MNNYSQNEEILVTFVTRRSYGTPTVLQSQAKRYTQFVIFFIVTTGVINLGSSKSPRYLITAES